MKREASQNTGCSHRYPRSSQLKSWELPTRLPLWRKELDSQATGREAVETSRPQMISAHRQLWDVGSAGSERDGRDRVGTESWELPTPAGWGFISADAGARDASRLRVKRLGAAPSPVRTSRPACQVLAGDQSMRWGRIRSSRGEISSLFHVGRSSDQLGAPNFQYGREV